MSDFTRIQEFILLTYNISIENATHNQIIEAINYLNNEDNYIQDCNSSLNEYGYIGHLNKGFPHQLLYRNIQIIN